jgi:hypothetical protein
MDDVAPGRWEGSQPASGKALCKPQNVTQARHGCFLNLRLSHSRAPVEGHAGSTQGTAYSSLRDPKLRRYLPLALPVMPRLDRGQKVSSIQLDYPCVKAWDLTCSARMLATGRSFIAAL